MANLERPGDKLAKATPATAEPAESPEAPAAETSDAGPAAAPGQADVTEAKTPEGVVSETPPLRIAATERLPRPAAKARHPLLWVAIVLGLALLATWQFWPAAPDLPPAITARSEILEIEVRLDALAFPPGEIDGVADRATADAIREFQRAAGLTEDGRATPALLAELRALTQ